MQNTASFVRHAIVTGVTILAIKKGIDPDAADGIANFFAMGVVSTLTWAVVKFLPPSISKILGFDS